MVLFAAGDTFDFEDFGRQLVELRRLLDRLHGVEPDEHYHRSGDAPPPAYAEYTAALDAVRQWAEDAEVRVEREDASRSRRRSGEPRDP